MKITDEEIIEWLNDGSLVVELENPATLLHRGRSSKCYVIGGSAKQPEGHTRMAFGLFRDGRRRTIQRSRLVYLAGSRELIPEGFEIHHLDLNKWNDAWTNLVMLTVADHRKIHGQKDI